MHFEYSDKVRSWQKILTDFMDQHVYPNEARFDDSIGIYPEFIDGYGILVLPTASSPQLELADPIACDWRPGDVW